MTTIAGTPVDIKLSKATSGWVALGRVYEGVLPGSKIVEEKGLNRKEAESRCRDRLERLIHTRTCGTE